jgi:hypothetical protein
MCRIDRRQIPLNYQYPYHACLAGKTGKKALCGEKNSPAAIPHFEVHTVVLSFSIPFHIFQIFGVHFLRRGSHRNERTSLNSFI